MLIRQGRVEQAGSARELYEVPATAFAADFIGAANLLQVDVAREREAWRATTADGQHLPCPAPPDGRPGRWRLVLRQEEVTVADSPATEPDRASLRATARGHVFLGGSARLVFAIGDASVKVLADRTVLERLPDPAWLNWPVAASRLVPDD